jgi:hypothetical protein
MNKLLMGIIGVLALGILATGALAGSSGPKAGTIKVAGQALTPCVEVTRKGTDTYRDLKLRNGPCLKGEVRATLPRGPRGLRGLRGVRGPAGPDSPDPNDPEVQDAEVQEAEVQNLEVQDAEVQDAEINDPDPNDLLLRLDGDFTGTNASVATSLDGVQFGPYYRGGEAWGSVLYTGANGLTLAEITQLSYTVKYSTTNDVSIGAPYLRIFLESDTHDVIFDPTGCATGTVDEDEFLTFEVVGSEVRYDDDACDGVPPDQQPWATVVAAHGAEVVSGIYVTTGASGGENLSAILRTLSVNGEEFTFGSN